MSQRREKPTKPWSMCPLFDSKVSELLSVHGLHFRFYDKDEDEDCVDEHDTNIMGRFICRNQHCPVPSWASKKIAITIRRYPDNQYNARVYHQSCKYCGRLSRPKLDHSYAERVAYRIQKWCGVQMDAPPFSGRSDAPHRSELCEGCKQGHCRGMGLKMSD